MKNGVRTNFALAGLLVTGLAFAQVTVITPGQEVRIGTDAGVGVKARSATQSAAKSNEASVNVGRIADDANIEGVTVINGKVWIDGQEVPAGVSRYKSPKNGKIYLIQRQGGSVSVSEAGGVK